MIRRSWTRAASIEETPALWATSLREIKKRIRPLFTQERVATNAASLLSQGRAIHGLRARWGRWLADTPEGRVICRRWKQWIAAQVKKYDWDIDPDDADHPTIHGLRGMGLLARVERGYEVDQIANDIGMSRQNVERYMRFRDQMKVSADGQKTASSRQPGESGEGNQAAMILTRYSSSQPAVLRRRRMESFPGMFRVRL